MNFLEYLPGYSKHYREKYGKDLSPFAVDAINTMIRIAQTFENYGQEDVPGNEESFQRRFEEYFGKLPSTADSSLALILRICYERGQDKAKEAITE